MRRALLIAALGLANCTAFAAEILRIPTDDGADIRAALYVGGPRAVILAHGGRFTRDSWKPQAEALNKLGFTVLAPDFRGFGESTGPQSADRFKAPLHLDLLGGVRLLRARGATFVAIVGGSLGGMAAGDAALAAKPGEIDAVVFLGASASLAGNDVAGMPGRKLFIVARDDANGSGTLRLDAIRADYERVPPPRALRVVDGKAHAQALFASNQAFLVTDAIVNFLSDIDTAGHIGADER